MPENNRRVVEGVDAAARGRVAISLAKTFHAGRSDHTAMVERGILSGPNVPDLYDPTHSVGWEPA